MKLTEKQIQGFDFSNYRLTPIEAIKLHCLGCMGFEKKRVATCHILNCSLWSYRKGVKEKVRVVKLSKLKENA